MPHFLVKSGADQGRVFPVAGDLAALGRNPENDIVLTDSAASRYHAQVRRRGSQYCIRDLASTHGTFVNGARAAEELPLSDNDVVQIGDSELIFKMAEAPEKQLARLPAGPAETGSPEAVEGPPIANLRGETIAFSMPARKVSAGEGVSERHWEVLSRVAEAIQSVFDLNELLSTLMDMVFDIFHPDRGAVLLREEPDGPLRPKVRRPGHGELRVSQTIIDHAVQRRMSLLVSNTGEDQRFSAAQSIVAQSILSAICSPLVCKDKVLGALYIDTQGRLICYQEGDVALLNIIAANAAIAIENALLVQQKLEAERLGAMGTAVAGISHYVKNVLFGISGSSNLIETALASDNYRVVKEIWPVLKRSNQRIGSLVQDMLTYSKKREPAWEQGNLNAVLSEVFESQASRAEKAGVELALELDETLPDSPFEPKAIHDTILNIVGNAIEACEQTPGARVILRSSAGPGPQELCAWVIDNGPGIPLEIQKRIFEPFFSTKGSRGTGLGLAVARKTVEEHQGRLLLESAPGKGSVFRMVLPLQSAEPGGAATKALP